MTSSIIAVHLGLFPRAGTFVFLIFLAIWTIIALRVRVLVLRNNVLWLDLLLLVVI